MDYETKKLHTHYFADSLKALKRLPGLKAAYLSEDQMNELAEKRKAIKKK
mgnify:CR=1 FL=1